MAIRVLVILLVLKNGTIRKADHRADANQAINNGEVSAIKVGWTEGGKLLQPLIPQGVNGSGPAAVDRAVERLRSVSESLFRPAPDGWLTPVVSDVR